MPSKKAAAKSSTPTKKAKTPTPLWTAEEVNTLSTALYMEGAPFIAYWLGLLNEAIAEADVAEKLREAVAVVEARHGLPIT